MRCSRALRVLVVDDEKHVADTLSLILKARGHLAQPAYRPETALQLINDFQPEVLISDVLMPNMDGLELSRRLTSRFPSLRVLLISGSAIESTVLNETKRRGRDFAFMQKPVHPGLIVDFVDTCSVLV